MICVSHSLAIFWEHLLGKMAFYWKVFSLSYLSLLFSSINCVLKIFLSPKIQLNIWYWLLMMFFVLHVRDLYSRHNKKGLQQWGKKMIHLQGKRGNSTHNQRNILPPWVIEFLSNLNGDRLFDPRMRKIWDMGNSPTLVFFSKYFA